MASDEPSTSRRSPFHLSIPDRFDYGLQLTDELVLEALANFPWSPITSAQMDGELPFILGGHGWYQILRRLEREGLVARVPNSKPVLWYLPGEEPYVFDSRQLTEEEEKQVWQRAGLVG